MNDNLRYVYEHLYKTAGTIMTGVGTLLTPSAGLTSEGTFRVIKIHQYSISAQGTICYTFNDSKPFGGTIDFGGYLNGGIISNPSMPFIKPFVPYPNYLCRTTTPGSALCLGTYITAGALGTVYFQCVYSETDSS